MKKNELSYKDLKRICNPNVFRFEDTSELEGINEKLCMLRTI